jgi:hypothetical protein
MNVSPVLFVLVAVLIGGGQLPPYVWRNCAGVDPRLRQPPRGPGYP